MSYTIDVFRELRKPEKNIFVFSLYICFFPQLIAGPIERSEKIIPQLKQNFIFDYNNSLIGVYLILIGLIKKMVVADNIASVVNTVYNNHTYYSGLSFIIATFFFCFQLYCDFSGYCDIAIGSAKLFNIHLSDNFKNPFLSQSIREFWKRWHITLSAWLHDYLYFPIVFRLRRIGSAGILFSVLITFAISGMWHGASWKFAIMGLLHAFYIIGEYVFEKIYSLFITRKKYPIFKPLKIIITFLLFAFSMIFFRGKDISTCIFIVKNLFTSFPDQIKDIESIKQVIDSIAFYKMNFMFYLFTIIFIIISQIYDLKNKLSRRLIRFNFIPKIIFFYILTMIIIIFGNFGENQFIYFQF